MNKILSIILFAVIVFSVDLSYSGAITDSEFSSATLASLNDITASSKGSVPVGTVIVWPVASDPEDMTNSDGTHNWLECNGQSFNTTIYSALSGIVGTKTPNYQGMFLRGNGSQDYTQNNGTTVGVTSTTYSSGTLGEVQGDASRRLTGNTGNNSIHGQSTGIGVGALQFVRHGLAGGSTNGYPSGPITIDSALVMPTAQENRPVNMAVRYLIRALP